MHTEVLSYEADGVLMQSHLYFEGDATGRPGILVFPEAFGLSQHAKTQAERLAGVDCRLCTRRSAARTVSLNPGRLKPFLPLLLAKASSSA